MRDGAEQGDRNKPMDDDQLSGVSASETDLAD
jgi:hypothetical protein